MNGRGWTYAILALYTARCITYACGAHWGRVAYWLCAAGITISAEFLVTRFP